jgi:hypothetical protein
VGLLTTLATAFVALLVMNPNLPVPNIQWPGGRPHDSRSPDPHPHRSAQAGVPGAGDDQRPTTAPQSMNSPTPTPTASPSPPGRGSGVLVVAPASIHFRNHDTVASLVLRARGGPVRWTAAASSPQVTLAQAVGTIKDHGQVEIQVTLNRGLITLPGTATITVSGGSGQVLPVSIVWDISVL